MDRSKTRELEARDDRVSNSMREVRQVLYSEYDKGLEQKQRYECRRKILQIWKVAARI